MSEAVERRIVAMLDKPLVCPHGSPIPGLEELGIVSTDEGEDTLVSLTAAATAERVVEIDRISEVLQPDAELLHRLSEAGMRPGHKITAAPGDDGVEVWHDGGERTAFGRGVTDHVFVRIA